MRTSSHPRMEVEVPLVHSYVDGLDKILGGGVPKGSTVLVAGTPGTMKTSLILWVMNENAKRHGTKGLYVSLEQDADSLRTGAARMGMTDLQESRVYILDMGQLRRGLFRAESSKDWVTILLEIIKEAVTSSGYGMLALDSLEALCAGILHLRMVDVGEAEAQLRLRCVKMRFMNHDRSALALNHDGEKFFVSHVISRKK